MPFYMSYLAMWPEYFHMAVAPGGKPMGYSELIFPVRSCYCEKLKFFVEYHLLTGFPPLSLCLCPSQHPSMQFLFLRLGFLNLDKVDLNKLLLLFHRMAHKVLEITSTCFCLIICINDRPLAPLIK